MQHNIVFGVLILTLGLFVWGKIRHDLVALCALFILVLLGITDSSAAFTGFGHPAVITVASVLIISKGLELSGLADLLGKWVSAAGNSITVRLIFLTLIVAFASAFMNNVGALAIVMPAAIQTAKKSSISPSKILMPLAFASLLGGMMTLIGTPPNIIISSFRAEVKGEPFGMFDFMSTGIFLTIAGTAFLSFIGWRLIPKRLEGKSGGEIFDIDNYLTEAYIVKGSKLEGKRITELNDISEAQVQVLSITRNKRKIHIMNKTETFLEGDVLILESDADELKTFIRDTGIKLAGDKKHGIDAAEGGDLVITEAVVTENSRLSGRSVSNIKLRNRFMVNLLAVARKDRKVVKNLVCLKIRPGDVLLLQGIEDNMPDILSQLGCLPLAKRELKIGNNEKLILAASIFALSVAAAVSGLLPAQISFSIAALIMVFSGILPVRKIYDSVDWPVIVLLGAMIPVGEALESSGGAAVISSSVLRIGGNSAGWMLIPVFLAVTMILSGVINNAATVILMAPISLKIAAGSGLSADPFLIAVAIGASSSFLTPVAHQSNTIVMTPGGYRFSDYFKLGIPMSLLVILLGTPLILFFWPL